MSEDQLKVATIACVLVVLASKLTRGAHLRTAFGQNRYRAEGLKQFGAVSGAVRLFREDHD